MSISVFQTDSIKIGARVENLERLLETFIGPEASWNKDDAMNMLMKGTETIKEFGENMMETVSSTIRPKRDSIEAEDIKPIDAVTQPQNPTRFSAY